MSCSRPNPREEGELVRSLQAVICLLVLVSALLCGGLTGLARAAPPQWASEYDLKAAFIYNLLSFVDWPEGAVGDRIVLGVAGEGPMADTLTRLFRDRRIGKRPIEVRSVRSRAELRACNAVLFAYPDTERMRDGLAQMRDTSVLTMGDGQLFGYSGGILAFIVRDNTFRLAINPAAVERAHLKISSKLLSMSELISDREEAKK